jgi:hypothetical protein
LAEPDAKEHAMTTGSISNAIPQYQVPATPKAQQDDERHEPAATRAKEVETGKDVAVPVNAGSSINIKA